MVIAVDDSKSMRENKCGIFAMEAVTLVSKALGRLEVGEVAVVGFGGAGSTKALHPLTRPFTDADGPGVLSQLHFDQASLSIIVRVMQKYFHCQVCYLMARFKSFLSLVDCLNTE